LPGPPRVVRQSRRARAAESSHGCCRTSADTPPPAVPQETPLTVVCQPQMAGYADPRWLQVGVTYRMLDYWTTTGVLRCDNPSPGSGRRRLWPESEIEVAARIVRLRRVGFPLDQAVEL